MKKLFPLLILITIILFCSCSGSKSIVGTNWYHGWKFHQDESGTLIPKCRSKRYRGVTGG